MKGGGSTQSSSEKIENTEKIYRKTEKKKRSGARATTHEQERGGGEGALGSVSSYTLNPKHREGWDGRKREGSGGDRGEEAIQGNPKP